MNSYLIDKGLSYQSISEIKAALLGAYDDFQDRVVKIYELEKLKINNDVWKREFTNPKYYKK